MIKSKLRKGLLIVFSLIFAISVGVYAVLGIDTGIAAADGELRVTMLDLMGRYPVDYVVGPVDVKDTNNDGKITRDDMDEYGHYTYYEDNAHTVRDANGNIKYGPDSKPVYTNNIYGIPAEQYFDVENYIYVEDGTGTEAGEKILRGWKADIRAVRDTTQLAENGEIKTGGYIKKDSADAIGIHVTYESATKLFGTTTKYALIVPAYVTMVGQGSAAFVANNTAYYHTQSSTNPDTYPTSNATYGAKFTDFACFITNAIETYDNAPYFWQPRERLAGVYFADGSKLKEIKSGTAAAAAAENYNRTKIDDIGKSAFQGCDNMRFMILPGSGSLTKIGDYAFNSCTHVVDINIPSSVEQIGNYAFNKCSEVLYISTPTKAKGKIGTGAFNECNKLKHVENGAGYSSSTFPSSVNKLYVFGGAPENGVLDNGRYGFLFTLNNGKWAAVAFAGETGEDPNKVFVFPDSEDFSANSDRRKGVQYDYIDAEGNKRKNTFDTNQTEYEIASDFAKNTWCRNLIIPAACTKIGSGAFDNSHVAYVETYARIIESRAFGTADGDIDQWVYFHKTKTSSGTYDISDYNISSGAFGDRKSRHVVFEDYALYKAINDVAGHKNIPWDGSIHYQIPIIAHINNEDSHGEDLLTLSQNDMADRFFMDSDYVANPVIKDGPNVTTDIIYTKRLSGYMFDNVKGKTGVWSPDGVADEYASPALSNMDSTVWYTSAEYTAVTNAKSIYNTNVNRTTSVDIYTKNIARPENIKNATFDSVYGSNVFKFGEEHNFSKSVKKTLGDGANEYIDYNTALGLDSGKYSVELKSFIYADGRTPGTYVTENIRNAGTYTFVINLNSKWGKWKDSYISENSSYLNTNATVERKKITFDSLDDIPQFVNAADGSALLNSTATTIYKYNDGWYVVQKTNGEEYSDRKTITDSFLYYNNGKTITIQFKGETDINNQEQTSRIENLYGVEIISRNGFSAEASSTVFAQCTFRVKFIDGTSYTQSNYIFDYGDTEYGNLTDETKGLSVTRKQDFTFNITKYWYIVVQTNMFVAEGNGGTSTPYAPTNETEIHYSDEITVIKPELNFLNDEGNIHFAFDYYPLGSSTAVSIVKESEKKYITSAEDLAYYINSSMPAGTYELTLYGSAVTGYPAINNKYTIVILPKNLDSDTSLNRDNKNISTRLHEIIRGDAVAGVSPSEKELDKWINASPLDSKTNSKQLHKSVEDIFGEIATVLKADKERGGTNTYWAKLSAEDTLKYYDLAVSIGYNIEGSGNNNYLQASATLNSLATAGTYTLYYCVSAKNYVSIGGADAADRQARGFRTTMYNEMALSDIYEMIVNPNNSAFKDVYFTGSAVYTQVPLDRKYEYIFDDKTYDYINVGKAVVILSVYDKDLARWNVDLTDAQKAYFKPFDNGEYIENGRIQVYYNIKASNNSWTVPASMSPWFYDGFDASINSITYGLTFGTDFGIDYTQVYFRIGKLVSGKYQWISVNGTYTIHSDEDDKAYFMLNSDGQIYDAKVIAVLKALPVGSYVLGCYVKPVYKEGYGPDADVTVINVNAFEPATYAPVNIWKTNNGWTETPGMSGWDYYGFKDGNFRPGKLTYTDDEIEYKLYEGAGTAGTLLKTFKAISEVSAYLKTLPVNTYTIYASTKGGDNYNSAPAVSIPFNVWQAENGWTSAPQIENWVYEKFNANLLKTGTATFGTDAPDTTVYTVQYVGSDGRVVTGKYAGAKENLSYDELIALLATLSAGGEYNGKYNLLVTVPETDNYESATQNIQFSVAKADNEWNGATPSITGWTYGGQANTPTPATVKKGTNINYIYKYYSVTNVNGTLVHVNEYNSETIKTAPAGSYVMEVTAEDEDGNYNPLVHTAQFTIGKSGIDWDNEPEDRLNWTWADDLETDLKNSGFVGATLDGMDEGIVYTLTYSIVATDPGVRYTDSVVITVTITAEGHVRDTAALFTALNALVAGNYRITITATVTSEEASANYNSLTKTVSISVARAEFIWDSKPVNTGWAAADGEDAKSAKIVTPSAHTAKNNTVHFLYTLTIDGSEEYNGSSFNAVKSALLSGKKGVYEITIVPDDGDGVQYGYSLNNYAYFTHVYTITITQSTNSWKDGKAPKTSYTYEYGTLPSDLASAFEADYGTVLYCSDASLSTPLKHNGSDITDFEAFKEHLKTLSANSPHSLYIGVKESNKEYDGLLVHVEITVTGIKSHWDNEGELDLTDNASEHDLVYSDGIDFEEVILPKHVAGGTTTYTITYKNYKSEPYGSGEVVKYTAEDVISWLLSEDEENGKAIAGTYTINVVFMPEIESFTALTYTVTVTVARATPAWKNNGFEEVKYGDYGSISIVEPELSQDSYYNAELANSIKISIIDNSNGQEAKNINGLSFADSGLSLAEYIKTLPVLANSYHTITWVLEESDNYEGLTRSCQLNINRVANNWSSSDADNATWVRGRSWKVYRGAALGDYKVVVPEATVGNETLVITLDSVNITSELNFLATDTFAVKAQKLNQYLFNKKLEAGEHTLVFAIEETGNYNGRTSNCTIVIEKKNNEWKDGKTLSDFSGTTVPKTFFIPTVKEYEALLRFDITRSGSKVNEQPITAADIIDELQKLSNGEFTLTAYIGGTGYTADGLDEYNKDYNYLDCSCTITLNPNNNDWKNADSLKGASWTWGNFDEEAGGIPMPDAKYGNDTIVYTISGANISDKEIRAADDNSSYGQNSKAENAFEAFKAFLKTLSAGSYNVTITIEATGDYTAPTPITRMFTVNQVNAKWDTTTQTNNGTKTYNWTLLDETNENVAEPALNYDTVKESDPWLKTARYTLTKDGATGVLYPTGSTSSWEGLKGVLDAQKAGTYYITVLIEGDDNHTELTYSVTVVINLAKNSWTKDTTGYGSDTMVDIPWVFGSESNQAIKFEAVHNNETLNIQVNRTVVPYEELAEYLNSLGVGQHVIIATVPATDTYAGLEKTVRVTISRATNTWQDGIELSIGQVSDEDTDKGWTWGNAENGIENTIAERLHFPVATAGKFALVVVTNVATGNVVLEATVNYTDGEDGKRVAIESDIESLVRKLATLDVAGRSGDSYDSYRYQGYTIKITVSETADYSSIESAEVKFVVKTAKNDWAITPRVEGFNYGGTVAYPSSLSYYGQNTVVYRYAKKVEGQPHPELNIDNDEWKESLSYEAGEYWVMGYVPAPDSDNYTELYGYGSFYIGAGENGWVNMPGVIAWNWDNYNKTVNVFSGSARSGGVATFTITGPGGKADYLDLDVDRYFLTKDGSKITESEAARLKAFEYERDNIISDSIARLLNALKPGSYLLWVTVAGGASLGSISSETGTQFTVGKAKNGWNTPPSVKYYIYKQYDHNLTAGNTTYGVVTYLVENAGKVVDGLNGVGEAQLINKLSTLNAGNYTLRAWVEGSDTFEGVSSKTIPYSTTFEVGEANNSWATGYAPASVSGYYAELHRQDVKFDYEAWLGTHQATANAAARYVIMDNSYKELHSGTYNYEQFTKEVAKLLPGEYIVRVSIKATNYLELSDYMNVTINKYSSRLTENSATSLTGRWTADGTVLDDVTIAAEGYYGTDTVVDWLKLDVKFIFEKETYTFAELKEAVKHKDSGSSYQVTVYLQETDGYYGISQVLSMTIDKARNAWDESFHNPNESFDGGESALSWQWKTEINWLGVRPKLGNKVVVRIISASDRNTVLKYLTIDPSEPDQIGLVSSFVRTLDKGTYYMLLAVPADTNWDGIGDPNDISISANTTVTFEVTTANNNWNEDDMPSFSISRVNGEYKWEYGTVVTASASAKYGEVSITYYKGQQQLSSMPTDVGTYKVKFKVITPTPLNYQDISEEFEFTITKQTNGGFTVNPGVAGWAWDNYDKDNNSFLGTPKSGGDVKFAIIQKNGAQVTEKVGDFALDSRGYAPANIITKLNELKAGQYYLRVTVAATANYVGFTDDSFYFSVSEAQNSWKQTPQMMSWSAGNWTEKSAPIAEPKYGTPVMWITSNVTGETIVTGIYNREEPGKFIVDSTALSSADIGLYTMHVTVAGETGQYEGLDEVTVAIEIYVQGSPDEGNFWIQYDLPNMNDWVAEINTVNLPTGKPARGQAYFIFYKAVFVDGQWVKADKYAIGSYPEGEGPEFKIIPAGTMYGEDRAYARDLYIPMEPGDYLMYGCAVNLSAPGKDDLGEDSASPSRFTIYNREIAWDQSVSIASILYLGDYYHPEENNVENWGAHSATTTLTGEDVKIRYEFYKWNETTFAYDDFIGTELPIDPGMYSIRAYAKAKYTKEIPSEMKFEVRLSQNAWTGGTSPSINSWSEEYNSTSPNPEGNVEHGTIVYTYINKANPNVEFSEKPTAAGRYILIARVVYEGYETLEATYEFTIEPAFDMTFLIICIALAVLATIMLFVVIYFAVRRNRET